MNKKKKKNSLQPDDKEIEKYQKQNEENRDINENADLVCEKCGNVMINEEGDWVCPHCQGEIDFFGDDEE